MAGFLFRGFNHANLYSKFRPSPPQELINSILNYLQLKVSNTLKQAVDVGCGSGQSTIMLAPYFEKVHGLDISEAQIEHARNERSAPNLEYSVSDCYHLPYSDSSVQLVTSAQSFHWFDTPKLFKEVQRILIPDGVFTAYGYWIPLPKTQNEEKNQKLAYLISEKFHEEHLGKYWHEGRFILKNHFADIVFPFKDIQRLDFVVKGESSLEDYIGYLSTWSAYQKLCSKDKEMGENILKDIKLKLLDVLQENKAAENIVFPLHTDFFVVMGRK